MSETEAEFLDRLEATPRYNPSYRTLDSDRLFALARRGAAMQVEPDWFWRALDPDDSGDTVDEALRFVPLGTVCHIQSSYIGPSFFAARVPVMDTESDDEETVQADTEADCILKVRERLKAIEALPPPPAGEQE